MSFETLNMLYLFIVNATVSVLFVKGYKEIHFLTLYYCDGPSCNAAV